MRGGPGPTGRWPPATSAARGGRPNLARENRQRDMTKTALNECPIEDLLRRRWSPRAFADRAVEPDKLLSLLEAARWAPSSFNEQPWAFAVGTRERPEDY